MATRFHHWAIDVSHTMFKGGQKWIEKRLPD